MGSQPTGDLVAGVNHHHARAQLVRQQPGRVAQQRGLAGARRPQQQQRAASGIWGQQCTSSTAVQGRILPGLCLSGGLMQACI